jgi:hypothetical protein
MRSPEGRNKPCGIDMFIFNEIIGQLGLLELQFKGRKFTWSNMQRNPLLEQFDWFLLVPIGYLITSPVLLAKIGSDHIPCVINIDTNIPKAKIFQFGNYWV